MATPAKKVVAPAPVAAPTLVELPQVDVAKVMEAAAAPAREMQENVRKAAEKGVEETRAAYARAKDAAEKATSAFETSAKTAADGVVAFNHKLVDSLRANSDATFDFVKSLLGVKSLSEAITLNSEHARKQFEAVTAQSKDLAQLAQKVATDSFAPVRAQLDKALAAKV